MSGYSGYCGLSGYSGYCGLSGYSGYCGLSGYSGYCGLSGYSGYCGLSGYSGFCGTAGTAGTSGFSGFSGGGGGGTIAATTDILRGDGAGNALSGLSSSPVWTGAHDFIVGSTAGVTITYDGTIASGAVLSFFPLFTGGTVTLTGGTHVTSPVRAIYLDDPIFTSADPTLIDTATTVYITDSPTASGSVTITNGYALWVDNGMVRFDGGLGVGITTQVGAGDVDILSEYRIGGIVAVPTKIAITQNIPLSQVVGTIVSKAGTITGTAGVGSSLFLQRLLMPALMNLSEIDAAMSIGFPVTSQGAGTMSRSMVLYSFGNSTSLASVASASSAFVWSTGTSTTAGAVSLRQFQGGWSSPLIQPMTFASTAIGAGEYVIGQIFNFAQASSTWTLNFYGLQGASSFLASAATNLTSATLGAVSVNTVAGSGVIGISSYASQFLALSTAGSMTGFTISATGSTATVSMSSTAFNFSATNTTKTCNFSLIGQSTNSNIISSIGTVAGSVINGLTTLGAVTNVALGALNSSTLAQLTLPNFGFIGNASTTSGFPTVFMCGIMSTGAIPTAITLTSAAVTYSGSVAFQQPWFALAGA